MQHELKLYDHLLQFPLFQGMSRSELLQMAGSTRFDFQRQKAGRILVTDGDNCNQLLFLIQGQIVYESYSVDHGYSVIETLNAPWLIQPEALFGITTRYSHTMKTLTDAQFFALSKDEVLRLLDDFLIIRLNLFNQLAALAQRTQQRQWRSTTPTLEARIIRFFLDHSVYPAGKKEFRILMTRLADEVNDSRLDVSCALNAMQQRGVISLHRGCIEIPLLERLLM